MRSNPSLMVPKTTEYIPHRPTPKQAAFLLLPHMEAFYGGEPGGGKSDALLMGALQYVDVPSFAAILFRRTFADLALPGALMDRSREWLMNTAARWNEQRKTWTFPSGATVSFGYLENENDKYRYQSAEFQYIAFDEVSQFMERQYTFLFTRLRRLADSPVPLRVRSASNPPTTADGQWVKERFVLHRSPQRPFIPAGLNDNPHIDKATYLTSLGHLDEVSRRALFDWFASVEGLVFASFNDENLTDEEPDPDLPFELAIDDGYFPDPRATLFVQKKGTHILVFDELRQLQRLEEETVRDVFDRCLERFGTEAFRSALADNNIDWQGLDYTERASIASRYGLPMPEIAAVSHEAPALQARLRRANIPARNWLSSKVEGGEGSTRVAAIKATRALIKDGNGRRVIQVNRRCKHLIAEITQGYRYPEGKKSNPDDRPADGNDHLCEALESWVWLRARR